jgi:hypothetical protein
MLLVQHVKKERNFDISKEGREMRFTLTLVRSGNEDETEEQFDPPRLAPL